MQALKRRACFRPIGRPRTCSAQFVIITNHYKMAFSLNFYNQKRLEAKGFSFFYWYFANMLFNKGHGHYKTR